MTKALKEFSIKKLREPTEKEADKDRMGLEAG